MASRRSRTLKDAFGLGRNPLGGAVVEHEQKLYSYFVEYDRLVEPIKSDLPGLHIHLGPKGVGKSAIQRIIKEREVSFNERVIEIRPQDLQMYVVERRQELQRFREQKALWLNSALWDFLIWSEVLRVEYPSAPSRISELFSTDKARDSAVANLLKESVAKPQTSLVERLAMFIDSVNISVPLAPAAEPVKVEVKTKTLDPAPASKRAGTFLSPLRGLGRFDNLLAHQYLILIDDLDREWSDTPEQRELLEGLLESALPLSRAGKLSFVIAMRDDVFRRLSPRDRDKVRLQSTALRWDEGGLKAMLEARIGWKLNKAKASGKLELAFEDGACGPIWRASAGNPRRAIEIAEEAIKDGVKCGDVRVDEDRVEQVIRRLSGQWLKDLAAQHRYTYRGLENVAAAFKGGKSEMSYEEFSVVTCAAVENNVSEGQEWLLELAGDPEALAHILLEVEFLLFKEGRKSDAQPFRAGEHSVGENCWLAVNPAYRSAIGLS